jgi:hypothetical protein
MPKPFRGVHDVVADQVETFSMRTGRAGRSQRRRQVAFQLALPSLIAGAVVWFDVELYAVGDLIAGVAVLAGLLFGLLILVWTEGIKVRNEGRWKPSERVPVLVDDLRANVTYASVVSLVLVASLMVAAATTPPTDAGTPAMNPVWAGVTTWIAVHMVLSLGQVLRRLRAAFLELSN